ncbi:MAG: hypothetical protein ACR2NU_15265, partial [Aeoliella sp.]
MQLLLLAELPARAPDRLLTREVFGNISSTGKLAFYCCAAAAVAVFVYGVYRRVRLWRTGKSTNTPINWALAGQRFLRDVLFQRRFRGRVFASLSHRLLFGGFVLLFVGTVLI